MGQELAVPTTDFKIRVSPTGAQGQGDHRDQHTVRPEREHEKKAWVARKRCWGGPRFPKLESFCSRSALNFSRDGGTCFLLEWSLPFGHE